LAGLAMTRSGLLTARNSGACDLDTTHPLSRKPRFSRTKSGKRGPDHRSSPGTSSSCVETSPGSSGCRRRRSRLHRRAPALPLGAAGVVVGRIGLVLPGRRLERRQRTGLFVVPIGRVGVPNRCFAQRMLLSAAQFATFSYPASTPVTGHLPPASAVQAGSPSHSAPATNQASPACPHTAPSHTDKPSTPRGPPSRRPPGRTATSASATDTVACRRRTSCNRQYRSAAARDGTRRRDERPATPEVRFKSGHPGSRKLLLGRSSSATHHRSVVGVPYFGWATIGEAAEEPLRDSAW